MVKTYRQSAESQTDTRTKKVYVYLYQMTFDNKLQQMEPSSSNTATLTPPQYSTAEITSHHKKAPQQNAGTPIFFLALIYALPFSAFCALAPVVSLLFYQTIMFILFEVIVRFEMTICFIGKVILEKVGKSWTLGIQAICLCFMSPFLFSE